VKSYVIRDIKDIGAVLDYVHDRHFNIEEVSFDKTQQLLRIPLTVISSESETAHRVLFLKVRVHPVLRAHLVIHKVTEYDLIDDAGVGRGDINTITVEDGTVSIKCGLPIVIKAKVLEFHIELVITDEVMGKKKFIWWK